MAGTSQLEDEIVLSPALVTAVRLEKSRRDPGIIVDRSVRKFTKSQRRSKKKRHAPQRRFTVHPFSGETLYLVEADQLNRPSVLTRKIRRDALRELSRFRKVIAEGLARTRSNKRSQKKWKYMAKRFNMVAKNVCKRLGTPYHPIKLSK